MTLGTLWNRICGLARLTPCVVVLAASLAAAEPSSGSKLQGELVANKGDARRFRLVGHPGTFTGDAAAVRELDGKPVEIELGTDGKVTAIRPLTIEIPAIEHGLEIVAGHLQVVDAAARRFSLAGDERVWVAPARVDVASLAGRAVEVVIAEDGSVREVRAGGGGAPAVGECLFEGHGYGEGESSCQGGQEFRCRAGAWQRVGRACAVAPPASCAIVDAVFAHGAVVCRAGREHRCDNGAWLDTGVACRP